MQLSKEPCLSKKPFWSARLKHSDIDLTGDCAKRQISEGTHTDALVLGNTAFSEESNVPYSWRIVILAREDWSVNFGICLESTALKMGFHQNLPISKFGLYLINSSLYLSNSQLDNARTVFEEENIFLGYHPKKNILTLRLEGEQITREIKVVAPPEGDHYRPCIGLWEECELRASWDF